MNAQVDTSRLGGKFAHVPNDLLIIDQLCEKWARWAGNQFAGVGWSRTSMTGKMMEWRRLGVQREKLYSAAGKDEAPLGVMLMDQAVARLPEQLSRCIYAEYFTGGTRECKAKLLGIGVFTFRADLRSALWALYGRLYAQMEMAS